MSSKASRSISATASKTSRHLIPRPCAAALAAVVDGYFERFDPRKN